MVVARKNNITDCIFKAVIKAAKDYCKLSGGLHLRKAPEYYLVVKVAEYLGKALPKIGCILELSDEELLKGKHFDNDYEIPDGFRTGRFDLLLTTQETGNPRHLVEFKRSFKAGGLKKDILRLKHIAEAVNDGARLESSFLVAIQRRRQSDEADDKIVNSRVELLTKALGNNFKLKCEYQSLGKGKYGCNEDEHILVGVFTLSLR